jgi:hypothetical protein
LPRLNAPPNLDEIEKAQIVRCHDWPTMEELCQVVLLTMAPVYVILCVIMIFVARALAYIASAILYVGEFIVRRIAEYPKGPVIALSTLSGASSL